MLICFISSPEPKACGELIGNTPAGICECVHASVGPFTLSDMNISENSRQIIIKFHLKHHWGRGLAALGFGPDRIRTLVSMATDSSHNGESLVSTLALPFFVGSVSFLQVTRTAIKAWMGSKFGKINKGLQS